ncbi:hypothetical protein MLD38_020044 [Melastoma candidum]|uniref:Uncharacterized protein n=1 Tax=Melastoma candidum TaxID=119954 RepID=A0ACB9QBW9_9MYRT|nr:hypothetical protein MLD38_020044 [Melastoma candidum]
MPFNPLFDPSWPNCKFVKLRLRLFLKIAGGRSQATLGPFLKMNRAKKAIRLFGWQLARVNGNHPSFITPIKSMSNGPLSLQLYLEHNHPSQSSNAIMNPVRVFYVKLLFLLV